MGIIIKPLVTEKMTAITDIGLSSFDTVTTLILSRLASFLPFFEVIPEIFRIFGDYKTISDERFCCH